MPQTHWIKRPSGVWQQADEPDPDAVITTFLVSSPYRPVSGVALHWQRLQQATQALGYPLPWFNRAQFEWDIAQFAIQCVLGTQVARVACTAQADAIWSLRPFVPYTAPRKLMSIMAERSVPQLKRLPTWQEAEWLKQAEAAAFNDVLRCLPDGTVSEARYANVFWIHEGVLYTPDPERSGCLDGTMRQVVIQQATQQGWTVQTGRYPLEQLFAAESVFLTNAVHGIHAVGQINDCLLRSLPLQNEMYRTFSDLCVLV